MSNRLIIAFTLLASVPASAAKYEGYARPAAHGLLTDRHFTAEVSGGVVRALTIAAQRRKVTARGEKAVPSGRVQTFHIDAQDHVAGHPVAIEWNSSPMGLAHGDGPEIFLLHTRERGVRTLLGSNLRGTPTRSEREFFSSNTPAQVVSGPGGKQLHFFPRGRDGKHVEVYLTDGGAPVQRITLLPTADLERVRAR